jgi:hypothetical protein
VSAASAAAKAAASSAAAAASSASAAAAAAASSSELYPWQLRFQAFSVDEMESRKADVRDFLLTQVEDLKRRHTLRRYIRHRSAGRRRQKGAGDSGHGYSFARTL